jgi:pyroglutamyl-peptidase
MAPTLLVTGFGPWPGVKVNPTAALVAALSNGDLPDPGACRLVTKVLPTEYRRSWTMLRRAVLRHRPDIILHFGFAPKAEAIALERFGRLACVARADAAGYAPRSGSVSRSGPERLATTVPLEPLARALRRARLPVTLSEDAGGYLCNATLYRSLQRLGEGRHIGFVHLPGRGPHADLEVYRRAASITIEATLAALPSVSESDS